MRSILLKIKTAKRTHKLVLPPTAAGSVALTYYLVNLVKATLDSSDASQPPKVEVELVSPTEATASSSTSPGTVAVETNDSESGKSDTVQGDQGVDNKTEATKQGDKATSPESPEAKSQQPESVRNDYTNPQTATEKPKEEQQEAKRDSGASRDGEGTPDGEQKPIDIERQINLLMELLGDQHRIWVIPLGEESISLDHLNLQRYIVERGTPLFKAALNHLKNPSTTTKTN